MLFAFLRVQLLVQAFENVKRGAKVVQSVTVVRDRCDDDEDDLLTPTPEAFFALRTPQGRAVPALPAYVCDEQYLCNASLRNAVPVEATAELFLVTNMELRKRLESNKRIVATTAKDDTFECIWPLDLVLLEIIDI